MTRKALALFIATLVGTPLIARATPEESRLAEIGAQGGGGGTGVQAVAPSNSLETREFHFQNARVPGNFSSHQDVTAWQVTGGSWNGQSLGGLYLVLVHTTSDDGRSAARTNCYVSDYATQAQRQALLTAFMASKPDAISAGERSGLRVEPAVITLELEGRSLTLHLGLVA